MIASDKLVRTGGLLRIRDDYEPVWRLANDEDGKSYIVRIGDDDGDDSRIYVADEDAAEEPPRIANTVYTVEEAARKFGGWVAVQMKRHGITRARKDLLEIWAKRRCRSCGEMHSGTATDCIADDGSKAIGCEHCDDIFQTHDEVKAHERSKHRGGAKKTANPAMMQAAPGMGGTQPVSSGGPNMGNGAGGGTIAGPTGADQQSHNNAARGWECPMCSQPLDGGDDFKEHMRQEHGVVDGD